MDMHIRSDYDDHSISTSEVLDSDGEIEPIMVSDVLTDAQLTDATTFCVIFSRSGKLVQHESRVWVSGDEIFNTPGIVEAGLAMFYIDMYPEIGLGKEVSRNKFIIVDKNEFKMVPPAERWDRYLQHIVANETFYINPYTGGIID
jgi:hypothetical protein